MTEWHTCLYDSQVTAVACGIGVRHALLRNKVSLWSAAIEGLQFLYNDLLASLPAVQQKRTLNQVITEDSEAFQVL